MSLPEYKASRSTALGLRTVVLVVDGGRVLLGLKNSGFGQGNFVGIGGKVEAGESVEDAAAREFLEETGASVDRASLTHAAVLDFYFPHTQDESWDQRVHVFMAARHTGTPTQTDEISPAWFAHGELPLDRMWDDARIWLPLVLRGHRLGGEFLFDANLNVVEHELADAGIPKTTDP